MWWAMRIKCLDDNLINYEAIKKNVGRTTIKVLPDLFVRIVIPMHTSDIDVETMIRKHLGWIMERRGKLTKMYPDLQIKRHYNEGELYRFLGKEYRLKISKSEKATVILGEDEMFICVKVDEYEAKKHAIGQWFTRQSTLVLNELFHELFESFQTTKNMPILRLRTCKTIWGSCNTKKNLITLNRKLIHLPIELIRYVIIHELVHLHHPNHGKDFYLELEKYVGDYKKAKREMKKHSIYYV